MLRVLRHMLHHTHTHGIGRDTVQGESVLTWARPTQTHQVKKILFMRLPVTLIVGHKTSKKQIFIAWFEPFFSTHTHHSTFQLSSHERTANSLLPTSCRGQFLNRLGPEEALFLFSFFPVFMSFGFSWVFTSWVFFHLFSQAPEPPFGRPRIQQDNGAREKEEPWWRENVAFQNILPGAVGVGGSVRQAKVVKCRQGWGTEMVICLPEPDDWRDWKISDGSATIYLKKWFLFLFVNIGTTNIHDKDHLLSSLGAKLYK